MKIAKNDRSKMLLAVKKIIVGFSLVFIFGISVSCQKKDGNSVVIYSTAEDFRNEHYKKRLREQFPNYHITLEYMPTGNCAAKLKAEGASTECDIIVDLDTTYLSSISDMLADLSSYDTSMFLDNMVPENRKYLTLIRFSGCIAINENMLVSKNIPLPASYADLIKPEYKNMVSMANPKTSGTGFFFLRNLVNTMGEDAAFAYFDSLAKNVLQFTSSGSGPVNTLIQGEVGIGLAMTFQAVKVINDGMPLKILLFKEGAPYSTTGFAMVKGKETRKAVTEVFDFFYSTLMYEDKELFMPEQVLKNQTNTVQNFPVDIQYGDMSGSTDVAEKERLLSKWKY